MHYLLLYSVIVGAASAASEPYSSWMASSFIGRGVPLDRHYANAVLYEGIRKASLGNSSLSTWASSQVSSLIASNGTLLGWNKTYYSLDDIRIGNNILQLWNSTHEEKYKTAATGLRNQLNSFPRNTEGGFWHRDPQYPNQMWLDGIYMASPFYATYTSLFDSANTTAWNDVALQFDLVEKHCRNASSGLLVHGYDSSKKAIWADPVTGASPHVWDRAVGWYFMALADLLQIFPQSLPAFDRLKGYYTSLAAALKKAQDGSGGWWLVMDAPYPGMKGNYIESSGTAMFTYGFLKGVRTGLIEEGEYVATAEKAYSLMTERFVKRNANGTLSWEGTVQVGSLDGNASYQYYIGVPIDENDYKGAGPFMFASVEMEMRGNTSSKA